MKTILLILLSFKFLALNGQVQHDWTVDYYPLGLPEAGSLNSDQIFLTSAGDIVCSWTINGSFQSAMCISSFNSSGVLNWEDTIRSPYDDAHAQDLSMDSMENFYLMGTIDDTLVFDRGILAKYDVSGTRQWVAGLNNQIHGYMSVVHHNKIYLLSSYADGAFVFDLNGNIIDTLHLDSASASFHYSFKQIVSSNSDLLVVGHGGQVPQSIPPNSMLYAARIINGDSVAWKKVIDPSPNQDYQYIMTADQSGNMFVSARVNYFTVNTPMHVFVATFNSLTGDTMWSDRIYSNQATNPSACDIEVDNKGNVYTLTNRLDTIWYETQLNSYNALTGNKNWSLALDSVFFGNLCPVRMVIDSSTNDVIVMQAYRTGNTTSGLMITRISDTGLILWKSYFNMILLIDAIAYDQQGAIYAGGGMRLSKFSILPTGINENDQYQIYIYPNPVHDLLYINHNTGFDNVSVRNLLGQEIYQKEDFSRGEALDCSSFKPGVYMLETYIKDIRSVKKFIKM